MALDAGTLEVKIVAKTDDATKSVQSFQESIEGVSETEGDLVTDTEESTGKIGGFFSGIVENVSGNSGLGGALKSVLGSLSGPMGIGSVGGAAISAIGLAVTAAIAIIKDLDEAAKKAAGVSDDLVTKSAKTGISTAVLQQMDYAAAFVDVETDTVISAQNKMIAKMDEARKGTETAVEAFERLNVEVTDANGNLRDPQEVMGEIINALGDIENYSDRLAIMQDIFGLANATDMMPLVLAGWDKYTDLQQEALDVGYVMTDDQLEKLNRLQDELDKQELIKTAIENQKGVLAEEAVLEKEIAETLVLTSTLRALRDKNVKEDAQNLIGEMRAEYMHLDASQLEKDFSATIIDAWNKGVITDAEVMTLGDGFSAVGTNIADGTSEGFLASWPAAAQSILNANEELKQQVFALWGIASPSKVMIGLSKNLVLGMAKGMDDNAHVAVKSAQELSENVYVKGMLDTDIISGIDRANASIGMAGASNNSTDNSRNVNVSVNQNNNYGDRSTLMGQHNSNRKLGSMISGAIASAM